MNRCLQSAHILEQKKGHIDPERPPQRNRPKLLQTHNLPTDKVENIKRKDLLLANKPWIVSRGTERMAKMIQRHRRVILHRSAHSQREQYQTSYGQDWQQKAYDMVPHRWIINCLKMYKISDEVINFIEKTWKPGKWNWQLERKASLKRRSKEVYFKEMHNHRYYL